VVIMHHPDIGEFLDLIARLPGHAHIPSAKPSSTRCWIIPKLESADLSSLQCFW